MNSTHFASSSDTRKANRTSNVNNVAGHDETSRFAHDDVASKRPARGWYFVDLCDRALMVDVLSPSERATLYWVVKAADSRLDSDGYRSVMTTMAWLAHHTGQSTRNVRRHIRSIEVLGILTDLVVGNNLNDRNHPNEWTFHPAQLVRLSPRASNTQDAVKTTRQLRREKHQTIVHETADETAATLAELQAKPKRNYATKATMPHIGLHHAVAARRAQQLDDGHADEYGQDMDSFDVDQWVNEHHVSSTDDGSDDWCDDADMFGDHDSDPEVAMVVKTPSTVVTTSTMVVNNLTTDVRLSIGSIHVDHHVSPNDRRPNDHLEDDDQRAGAHVRAYNKYPVDTDDESTGNVEEDSTNVVFDDDTALFNSYLDDLLAGGDVDTQAPTSSSTPTATADAPDQEQDLEGVVDQNSSDTATNTPAITASEQVTTTQTTTKQAEREATHTPTSTVKKTTKTEATDKSVKPTPSCAIPSHERDAAVLAQRAPKNATQARQWSASLYRLATAHHDPVAATVALHIASAWDGLAQWAASTTDSTATMAKASNEYGSLVMRFAVPVGEVIERVCEAWWRAESEYDGEVYPNIDTLEYAITTWFNERAINTIHAPIPRGEIHGRLAKYVAKAYRAEATGDSSFLPTNVREAWERRRWVRQNNRGHRTEKWRFEVPEDAGEWLLGWASANCIESTTALDLWAQFRREHIDQLAQSWRMLFVSWWKARCVS